MEEFLINVPYKEMLLLILGTTSTYLIWRIQHQKDKIKNIENQLSEHKYKMYSELIYWMFDIFYSKKLGIEITDKEIFKRMINIKRDMFIYASDEMFQVFKKWVLQISSHNSNNIEHFKTYFELMKLVRKDMGHKNTQVVLDDFMLFLMQDEDEYKKFKEDYNW